MSDALLKRVEAASGPDRELDGLIATALGWRPDSLWPAQPSAKAPSVPRGISASGAIYECPHYTASLDAALALCSKLLPGRDVNLEIGNVGPDRVTSAYISGADGYFEEPKTADAHGYGTTPALALLAAILKAKET